MVMDNEDNKQANNIMDAQEVASGSLMLKGSYSYDAWELERKSTSLTSIFSFTMLVGQTFFNDCNYFLIPCEF